MNSLDMFTDLASLIEFCIITLFPPPSFTSFLYVHVSLVLSCVLLRLHDKDIMKGLCEHIWVIENK